MGDRYREPQVTGRGDRIEVISFKCHALQSISPIIRKSPRQRLDLGVNRLCSGHVFC